MQTVMLRVLSGFIPLLIVALYRRQIHIGQLKYLLHFAVMSVLATTFYYYGFVAGTALIPTSIAGLLSGTIPIFTFICAFLFLRQDRPTFQMLLGVMVGFIGIVISTKPWEGAEGVNVVGVLWMLAGTTSLGISFVYAQRQLSSLKLPPVALATWQTGCASLTLLVLTDFSGITNVAADLKTLLGLVIGLGIFGTGGAFFLYYYVIEKLGSVKASGGTYIAPVVAVVIGAFVGEKMDASIALALILILGGVILIQTGKHKTPRPIDSPVHSASID